MNKIIIYGGQGYIGRYIIKKLQKTNDIFNISPSKYKKNIRLNYLHVPGQLWNNVEEIKKISPEYFIISFFGNPSISSKYLYDKIINSIIEIDKILLKPTTFIFFSSQLVYGNTHSKMKLENDLLHPISVYAKKCKEMEEILANRIRNNYIILRLPIIYGGEKCTFGYKNIVDIFIDSAVNGADIKVYGSGNQVRTFLHICDLSNLVKTIISSKIENEIINASSGDFLSIIDLANLIAKYFKMGVVNNLQWPTEKLRSEAVDIRLSNEKAAKIFKSRHNLRYYINKEYDEIVG